MADRGGICEASLSVIGASDQIVDIQCDPCKFEETVSEGIGYCIVCKEYLCRECLRAHKKNTATRGHKLLEGSELPKSRSQTASSGSSVLCELHQSHVNRYCKTHQSPVCDICLKIDHRGCRDVVDFGQIAQREGGTDRVDSILTEIQSLTEQFKTLRNRVETTKQNIKKSKQDSYDRVKKFRRDINAHLDKLEQHICQEIDNVVDTETKAVCENIKTIEAALKSMELAINRIEKAKQCGREHVFLTIQKVRPGLTNTEQVLIDARNNNMDVRISFVEEKMLIGLTTCQTFGKVKVNKTTSGTLTTAGQIPIVTSTTAGQIPTVTSRTCTDTRIPGNMKTMRLTKAGTFSVEEKGDKHKCCITGIAVLSSGDILMCDNNNMKVKLLDSNGQVISSVVMSDRPWNVAVMSDSEAAVTVPYSKTIQVVVVQGKQLKLQKYRCMKTDKKCWGLVYHRDNLYVSCHDDPGNSEIILLDRQGQLVTRIPNTDTFQSPSYIAVDHTDRLYISDWGTHTITCMDITGNTVYTRTGSEIGLNGPRGLLVDSDQNLYVVGAFSNNIQILNSEGRLYKSLVKEGEGMGHPLSIAYRTSDNILMVGMLNNNNIQCYRFV